MTVIVHTYINTNRAYHGYADLLADWEKRERCVFASPRTLKHSLTHSRTHTHSSNTQHNNSEAADARAKAKAVPLLRLSPTVPMGGMVFIEGGTPGEVDYF